MQDEEVRGSLLKGELETEERETKRTGGMRKWSLAY